MLNTLEFFGEIIANVNVEGHPFFTDAELAFFDSEDADFGEIPVVVSNPDLIIAEIFDENKGISYFCKKYPLLWKHFLRISLP